MILIASLLISLFATLVVELMIALICGPRTWRSLLVVLLVNLATNPAVVLLYNLNSRYFGFSEIPAVLILEIGAIIVEAVGYCKADPSRKHPVLFAAIINVISFSVGKVITTIFS